MHFEPPRPSNHDERVLPLINIIFLLLIFFMIVGRLSTVEPFELEPPKSASEAPADLDDQINLSMSADAEVALNGELIALEILEARLSALLDKEPKPPLQLKADGNAKAEDVLLLLDRVRAAGGEKMHLITLPRDR